MTLASLRKYARILIYLQAFFFLLGQRHLFEQISSLPCWDMVSAHMTRPVALLTIGLLLIAGGVLARRYLRKRQTNARKSCPSTVAIVNDALSPSGNTDRVIIQLPPVMQREATGRSDLR